MLAHPAVHQCLGVSPAQIPLNAFIVPWLLNISEGRGNAQTAMGHASHVILSTMSASHATAAFIENWMGRRALARMAIMTGSRPHSLVICVVLSSITATSAIPIRFACNASPSTISSPMEGSKSVSYATSTVRLARWKAINAPVAIT